MAAATVISYGGQERATAAGLHNKTLHRWSLTIAANGDTFDTGLGNKVGIVEVALTGTRINSPLSGNTAIVSPSTPISFSSISNGVITFSAVAGSAFDLLVWTNE